VSHEQFLVKKLETLRGFVEENALRATPHLRSGQV
jgi:hypothetical protein